MVAVAIGGAAVLGAGASIIGGSKAASAQKSSAQAAINEQNAEYQQTRADYAPWRAAGQTALGSLMSAYGLGGSSGAGGASGAAGGSSGTPSYGGFQQSPGYQWELDQGEQAVNRNAAARGNFASGGTIKAEQRYATGLASQDFNNYTGGLAQIAGLGQAGTNATTAAGTNAATNVSNELIASGNAQASSYANTASSINSGLNNAMSAYLMGNMGMFGGTSGGGGYGSGVGFSDRRLKANIIKVGEASDGLGIYEWNWKSSGEKARGVIADEVEQLRPWAFVRNFRDGYDGVNYATLGAL